jgi:plasmid stabilization system protein ParE
LAGGKGQASQAIALSYSVHVRRAAELDVAEALEWYEAQQVGLAAEFCAEFESLIERLSETPLIFPERYRSIRRALLHRFPYLVWYRIQDSEVTVLACTHGKINPESIPDRIS